MISEAQFSLAEPTVIVAPVNCQESRFDVIGGTEIFVIPHSRPAINAFVADLNKLPLNGVYTTVLIIWLIIHFALIAVIVALALTETFGAWIVGIITAGLTLLMVIMLIVIKMKARKSVEKVVSEHRADLSSHYDVQAEVATAYRGLFQRRLVPTNRFLLRQKRHNDGFSAAFGDTPVMVYEGEKGVTFEYHKKPEKESEKPISVETGDDLKWQMDREDSIDNNHQNERFLNYRESEELKPDYSPNFHGTGTFNPREARATR